MHATAMPQTAILCLETCFSIHSLHKLSSAQPLFWVRRTSESQVTVEGKLLSEVDSSYPGSIVWWDNQYKFGKKQGGLNPNDTMYDLVDIPVVKACSKFAGGALFLAISAGDESKGAHIKFWAAPKYEDLYDKGGACPPRPTPAPTAAPTPVSQSGALQQMLHKHTCLLDTPIPCSLFMHECKCYK
jgi:hypothetical protein